MGNSKRIGQLAGEATDAYLDYNYVKPARAGIKAAKHVAKTAGIAAKFGVETALDLGEGFAEGFTGQVPPPPLPGQSPFTGSEQLPALSQPVWPPREIALPENRATPPGPSYGDPSYFPLPLTKEEEITASGELVAGPASMGRFPATAAEAIQNPSITAARPSPPLPLPLPAPRPSLPVVEGVTMRRVESGRGDYGANLDLTPQDITRQTPMSLEEAKAQGLIIPSTPKPFFRQYGNAPEGPNAGMGMKGDDERAAMDNATRRERWGQSGSTTRSRSRAAAVIDQVRATRAMREQSRIRSNEAMRTPQLQTGAYVGQAWVPDGNGGGSVQTVDATTGGGTRSPKPMTPAQAANILKQAAQLRAGDKMKMITPDPETADAMENMLRAQGYDVDSLKGRAKAPAPTPSASAPATASAAPDKALPKTRKGKDGKTYTLAADGKYYPQSNPIPQGFADGTLGQYNGKKYIRQNGHWSPVD